MQVLASGQSARARVENELSEAVPNSRRSSAAVGDEAEARALPPPRSRAQVLLGDLGRAAALQERLAVLTASRADVTQDEGSYSRFLDKDEDYEANRRRIMGG